MQTLLPKGWPRPRGYANGIVADGRQVYVAGMVGWRPDGTWETDDMTGQIEQALKNIIDVLAEAEAGPEHIVRMTWYVTDSQAYSTSLKKIGSVWRDIMGKNFPVMAVVEVVRLVEERAKVEIETTAVVPAKN